MLVCKNVLSLGINCCFEIILQGIKVASKREANVILICTLLK